jgi:dihydrodipicolinate reductase
MTQLNIAVAGASGRMGRMLIETIAAADDAAWPVRSTAKAIPSSARTPAPSRAS